MAKDTPGVQIVVVINAIRVTTAIRGLLWRDDKRETLDLSLFFLDIEPNLSSEEISLYVFVRKEISLMALILILKKFLQNITDTFCNYKGWENYLSIFKLIYRNAFFYRIKGLPLYRFQNIAFHNFCRY